MLVYAVIAVFSKAQIQECFAVLYPLLSYCQQYYLQLCNVISLTPKIEFMIFHMLLLAIFSIFYPAFAHSAV